MSTNNFQQPPQTEHEDITLYTSLSHSPDYVKGHKPRPEIYRDWGETTHGDIKVTMPMSGKVDGSRTNQFSISYTTMGNKGPVVAFLHGVPTNKLQWYPVQKLIAPFCRTISFDMLGMGKSSKVRDYNNNNTTESGNDPWDWVNDAPWIDQVMKSIFPNEKFFFVADDWGGGILSHYAAIYSKTQLQGIIYLDPIAFDGYPVNEIQAFGRASQLPDDKFIMAMGAADQTMVQIFKTMVYDPNKYNQYNLKDITFPYIDDDYERNTYKNGEDASSVTMRPHMEAMRVLTDRAAVLAPALLLPYDPVRNPKGVEYGNITVPVLVLWGEFDNMMPANQIYRFALALHNTDVQTGLIPRAGHFAGTDQPERVAEEILNFIRRIVGTSNLGDIFLGYTGIWKGDEENVIDDMRHLYDL